MLLSAPGEALSPTKEISRNTIMAEAAKRSFMTIPDIFRSICANSPTHSRGRAKNKPFLVVRKKDV